MSGPDPIGAAEAILAAEARARSPVFMYVSSLADFVPGFVGAALKKVLDKETHERLAYMSDALKQELIRLRSQVEALAANHDDRHAFAVEEWPALALDGFRRAERTRANDRIRRIAAILANSLTVEPTPNPDEVEEMMRIASDLSDRDVVALRAITAAICNHGEDARQRLYAAMQLWKNVHWIETRLSQAEQESICLKLSSYGLLSRLDLPPNQNVMTSEHNAYEVLPKAWRFVQFIMTDPQPQEAGIPDRTHPPQ